MRRTTGKAKVVLLLIVGFLVSAGAGVGVWWMLTEIDRQLEDYKNRKPDWDYLAAHADNPRVAAALTANLDEISREYSNLASYGNAYMENYNKAFSKHAPTDDVFVAAAARVWDRSNYKTAATWVKGFDADPRVTAALKGDLIDCATREIGWRPLDRERLEPINEVLSRLLPELERRGVTVADPEVAHAAVSIDLRYHVNAIEPWAKKVAGTPQMTSAVVAHLERVGKSRSYTLFPGEFERLIAKVVELKPEPTDAMLAALGKEGRNPLTDKPFAVWKPDAVQRLVALRDGMEGDGWDRTQTSFLVGRLGVPMSAPEIRKLLSELLMRGSSAGIVNTGKELNPRGPLVWDWVRPDEFSAWTKGGIPTAVEQLVKMGPRGGPALVEVWKYRPQRLELYVTSRALAQGAPLLLAKELDELLEKFEPLARKVAEKGTALDSHSDAERFEWHSLGPVVLESMAALGETEKLPDECVACLWHALQCPSPAVSELAGRLLEKQVPADLFTRGLFVHLSQKARYQMSEVDGWVGRATKRPECGPHVAQMLGLLSDRLGGPEGVPMIQKLVGLRSLAVVGDAGARPVLERYAKDTTTYKEVYSETRGDKVVSSTKTEKKFADLAKAALEAIK